MKRYIMAATLEGLAQQFSSIPDEEREDVIFIDPTARPDKEKPGKYAIWLLRQYKNGSLTKDQFQNVEDGLQDFARNFRKYPKSDLGQYATVGEFLEAVEEVNNRELTEAEKKKMLKKRAHNASDVDKKFIAEDGEWECWQPLTYEGSISLARTGGTKASWCTAYEGNDHYWTSYTQRGPLYIFLNTSDPGEKYQLHIPSKSWYDINDRSKGMNAFYEFLSNHPNFAEYFDYKADPNGFVTFQGNVLKYNGPEDVVMPDYIDQYDSKMFSDNNHITSVDLSNITTVGSRTFENCPVLTTVVGNNVRTVSSYAFVLCVTLTQFVGSQLESIGARAFMGTSLQSINTSSVRTIGEEAFRATELTSLRLPKVKQIPVGLCRIASELRDVQLSRSLEEIGAVAFENCSKLTNIVIPESVDSIGRRAFANCTSLTTITIPKRVSFLAINAFEGCSNLVVQTYTTDWDKRLRACGVKDIVHL